MARRMAFRFTPDVAETEDREMTQNGGNGGGGEYVPRTESVSLERDVEIRKWVPPEDAEREPAVEREPIPAYVPPPPKPPILVAPRPLPEADPEPEPLPVFIKPVGCGICGGRHRTQDHGGLVEPPLEIAVVEKEPITPLVIVLPPPILIEEAVVVEPEIVAERPSQPPIIPFVPILPEQPPEDLSEDQKAVVALGRNIDGEQSITDAIQAPSSAEIAPIQAAGFEEPPTQAQIAGRGLLWLVLVGVVAPGVLKIFPEQR